MKRRRKIVIPNNLPSVVNSLRLQKQQHHQQQQNKKSNQKWTTTFTVQCCCIVVIILCTSIILVYYVLSIVVNNNTDDDDSSYDNKPIQLLRRLQHSEELKELHKWQSMKHIDYGTLDSHAYIPHFLLEHPNEWKNSNSNVTTILTFDQDPTSIDSTNNNHHWYDKVKHLQSQPYQLSISCEQDFGLINDYCNTIEQQQSRCEKQTYDVQLEQSIMKGPMLMEQFNQVVTNLKQHSSKRNNNIQSLNSNNESQVENEQQQENTSVHAPKCKTLWFAGFSEASKSRCHRSMKDGTGGIRMDYSLALRTAQMMANETIQPVLLLGRYGLEDNEWVSPLRRWANDHGAIVITIKQVSFQNDILNWHTNDPSTITKDFLIGPYLILDIPKIIRQHNLFTIIPNICPRHVLVTDSDVMFLNPITHHDLNVLKNQISPSPLSPSTSLSSSSTPFIMYGREDIMTQTSHRSSKWYDLSNQFFKQRPAYPINTGVMLIDVYRYEQMFYTKMIDFRNTYPYPERFIKLSPHHDRIYTVQYWFNLYFKQNRYTRHERTLLPIYYNWKLYWTLDDNDSVQNIKIIHYHGPKPNSGAWVVAQCDLLGFEKVQNKTRNKEIELYTYIQDGICCDYGKIAYRVQTYYNALRPLDQEIC